MERLRFLARHLAAVVLIASSGSALLADRVGYSDVYDCKSESSLLIAEHHHDWSHTTRDARWKLINTNKDLFGTDNDFSFLIVTHKITKKPLFRAPVPALRCLWISPDSRFIVGISNVKLWNPVQVVVFNPEGRRLFHQAVKTSSFADVSESVTNWVCWYKEPSPNISIIETKGWIRLQIEGQNGEQRTFKFRNIK